MELMPVMDTGVEYGLVFDGGGARGAYQIGAWKALKEAGIKISGVAGTSVGALNGALVCMDNVEKAEEIWRDMTFSMVMDVDDEWMERFFQRDIGVVELFKEVWFKVSEGGVDITPLRELIHQVIDEKTIRQSGKEFVVMTFSLSEMKALELSIEDMEEGLLEDYLMASAYLLGFKNEPLHGNSYIDGGVINNAPIGALADRGYKDIITVRIHGPGRVPRVRLPEDAVQYEISPRIKLGSIIDFSEKRSRQNLTAGYYDAKRVIYGLEGYIYYLKDNHSEEYYHQVIGCISPMEQAQIVFALKLPISCTTKELFFGMLEASAKLLRVQKYCIYTVSELYEKVIERYSESRHIMNLPRFVHILAEIEGEQRMNLKGRSFLTLKDFTPQEITYLLDLSAELKEKKMKGIRGDSLKGKNIALIFEKPSTRTRCAFTVGVSDEGGIPTYLSGQEIQLGHKESIEDTARVLGRMFDGIEFRGFQQAHVEALARYSGVPVWNGLTDEYHPTQILADLLTMREQFGYLKGLNFVYLGDGRNNMANSLMIGCTKMGVNFSIISPKALWPEETLEDLCRGYAKDSGSRITITDDIEKVRGADVIYTDVWASMGEEEKAAGRMEMLSPYQVNEDLMEKTGKETTIFMHCLPAVKGKEVTEEVFEGEASVVFEEAENRMHTIKAVIVATLGNE